MFLIGEGGGGWDGVSFVGCAASPSGSPFACNTLSRTSPRVSSDSRFTLHGGRLLLNELQIEAFEAKGSIRSHYLYACSGPCIFPRVYLNLKVFIYRVIHFEIKNTHCFVD
jgi:hypothetical protein